MLKALLVRYPALGFARYRRYWLASFASVGATQLITLGQGWLVFELSESALQLGVLGAAAALPNILMTLIGGVVADRFDKRIIMMVTSGLITLLLALLAWLDYTQVVQVWHVLSIAAVISLITGLDWPARVAIYTQLVDRDAMMSAVALNSFIWQAARMAMPAFGGLLIAYADTWLLFALGAAGFFTMLIVISGIHVSIPPPSKTSPLQELFNGIRFIVDEPLFMWLLGLTFVGSFFANSYVQILPVFAAELAAGETGYGYLLSAGGTGSIAGTLLVTSVAKHRALGRIMLWAAAISAANLALFVLVVWSHHYYLALALVFATAAFASVFLIASMTVLQLCVPDKLRGRVMGIHTIGYSLVPLGGLFLGSLATLVSPGGAVIVGCSIYLIFIAILALRVPVVTNLSGIKLQNTKYA